MRKTRLAFVVTHPIQYYAPLHQRLARQPDLEIKVFFTWHAGERAMPDRGFGRPVRWDLPLTEGYEHETVPNAARRPGDHHFFGVRNPALVERLLAWRPDAVHITGWAFHSHFNALREISKSGIAVLFRGDSHLLDGGLSGPRWWLKKSLLRTIYSWPRALLYAGEANRAYYEAFSARPDQLYWCPHSVDVGRFADADGEMERRAGAWRRELGFRDDTFVLLFAGKLEPKKRPLELMRRVCADAADSVALVVAGSGPLEGEAAALAAAHPGRLRLLPFQNQSLMPALYRVADAFILPSSHGETWGLAVNEAMACGRPVLVSDRVGCAADLVDPACGRVFPWNDWRSLIEAVDRMAGRPDQVKAMGEAAARKARGFAIDSTERALRECLGALGVR